jgi:2-amino-4-hydroxy-6-hydroxymethyldihydropteridine diphosphokinase
MSLAYIAYGGNLATSPQTARAAIDALSIQCGNVISCSTVHPTQPMGAEAGGEFINGAIALETPLGPLELLQHLHAIEAASGRERELHWGPRVLDLDLILYDQVVIETPELVVPHPAMWYRGFVLKPLAEIASQAIHPGTGYSIGDLSERLDRRPIVLELIAADIESADQYVGLIENCRTQFPLVELRVNHASSTGFDPQTVFARMRLIDAAAAAASNRTQPGHAPPFVIDICAPARTCSHSASFHEEQLCDIVTAITA